MLISIITPSYNSEKYLRATYESVKSQTHEDWEWLVVDDHSQDQSWVLLEELSASDKRIRIFKNSANSGPSFSRNRGLAEAHGEFIAFLDADDLWMPEKLEKQLDFMVKNELPFSCHSYRIMSESGRDISTVDVPKLTTMNDIKCYNPLATSFTMIKKSVLGDLKFDLTLKRRQDWIFWYLLLKKVKSCHSLTEVLGKYRRDSIHSISRNKFRMACVQWNLYRNYFKLGRMKSLRCFTRYAIYGVRKHFIF